MANPDEWNETDIAILRVQFPALFMFEDDFKDIPDEDAEEDEDIT